METTTGLTVRCCDLGRKRAGGGFQVHTFKEYISLDENFLFSQILYLMKFHTSAPAKERGKGTGGGGIGPQIRRRVKTRPRRGCWAKIRRLEVPRHGWWWWWSKAGPRRPNAAQNAAQRQRWSGLAGLQYTSVSFGFVQILTCTCPRYNYQFLLSDTGI